MAKKEESDSQLPVLRKPDPLPDWIPQTSDGVSIDDIVREVARIGFDVHNVPAETRLKALEKLMKHKGGYIERTETRNVDGTKVEIAKEMFRQMTLEEKREWLSQHMDRVEAHTIPVAHSVEEEKPVPEPPRPGTLEKLHGK